MVKTTVVSSKPSALVALTTSVALRKKIISKKESLVHSPLKTMPISIFQSSCDDIAVKHPCGLANFKDGIISRRADFYCVIGDWRDS